MLEGLAHAVDGPEQLGGARLRDALHGRVGAEVGQGQLKQGPGDVEAKLEGAALVGPAVVVVGGGDVGRDGGQVRGLAGGAQPLGRAHVGRSDHTDPAAGPWLGGSPLHGVVAVVDVVDKAVELTAPKCSARGCPG